MRQIRYARIYTDWAVNAITPKGYRLPMPSRSTTRRGQMSKRASASIVTQRETAWRNRFARFAASKQSVEAFCRSEAVSVASFYGWRTRLRGGQGTVRQAPRTMPAPFIDLGSVSSRANSTTGSSDTPIAHHQPAAINLRLDLGGGVVLYIARH